MKKIVLLLVVVGVVALAGWQIHQRVTAEKQEQRRGVPVAVPAEVSPVRRAAIRDVKTFTGTLVPKSQFLVAPKVAGRLEKLLVNVGDPVQPGQVIAELDDEEFAQQVEEAKAELQVARGNVENCASDLEIASRELERSRALREKKIASESDLDTAQARYSACQARQKVALAQVAQKAAALQAAQIRLSYTKVQAVWEQGGGQRVVGERFVDEGALLKANEPIVSVLEIDELTGVIYVLDRDYSKVGLGQSATVTTDAFPGRSFAGRIVRIAPLLKESSRQGRLEMEIPNSDRLLKPGMFIRAAIEFARHESVTAVPLAALVKRNGREGVFLANPQAGTARFVPVTVGIVEGELAEVVEPPLSGQVVTLGQHLLEDGSPIVLPGGPTSRPADETRRRPGGATSRPAAGAAQ